MVWIWILLAALFLLNAWIMRRNIQRLDVLEPSDNSVSPEHIMLCSSGVVLEKKQLQAASSYMRKHQLDVLDLIPANFSTRGILSLAQMVHPLQYRSNPFLMGYSALHATMVSECILEHAKIKQEELSDPFMYNRVAIRLKLYASTSFGFAIDPHLQMKGDKDKVEAALFENSTGKLGIWVKWNLGAHILTLIILLFGLWVNPLYGIIAILTYHIQPLIVFVGTKITPMDWWHQLLLRLPLECWKAPMLIKEMLKTSSIEDQVKKLRPQYEKLLANGIEHFFESRRTDCPLCSSQSLSAYLQSPDLFTFKPGRFILERCNNCGLIFQNPRLSLEGLNFYYKDVYDGLGKEFGELVFGYSQVPYIDRANILVDVHNPKKWLDVGTCYGHFCAAARSVYKNTQFDGLDMSDSIYEAARRRWIVHSFRGQFSELANGLRGSYDVVSMYHYLEHTLDPKSELLAANKVLCDGGYLTIEVPNPEALHGRLFRQFWTEWCQPQHLHLIPVAKLKKMLTESGFVLQFTQYGPKRAPFHIFMASYMLLKWLAQPTQLYPWRKSTKLGKIRTYLVYSFGFWILIFGALLDQLSVPFLRFNKLSCWYRVLAQKKSQVSNSL